MILALAMLCGTFTVGLIGHRPLLWLAQRRVDPTVVLTAWILSSCGLVISAVAAIAAVAVPSDDHVAADLLRLAGGCWSALTSGAVPKWREAVALLAVGCLVLVAVRIGLATAHHIRSRVRRGRQTSQLRLLAAAGSRGEPVWIAGEQPMAVALTGRPGMIVMTEGLRRRLGPAALAATLEHERAHLRGHHHALLTFVEVISAALPICPLWRGAPAATRDLIELAADAAAARRCGPAAVSEALRGLTDQPVPAIGLGMSGPLTTSRLDQLAMTPGNSNALWRAARCAATAVAVLALPAATGTVLVGAISCVVG